MKKIKINFLIIVFLLLISQIKIYSQVDTCHIYPTSVLAGTFYLPELQNLPPLNPNMPFDCSIGYLLMDTLAKSMPDSTLLQMPFNISLDSLLLALRYKYNVQDYNPSLAISYLVNGEYLVENQSYKSYPASTYFTLNRVVEKRIEEIGYAFSLLYLSDYVIRVKVNCADNIIDSVSNLKGPWTNIESDVLSIIKGQVLPDNCNNTPSTDLSYHKYMIDLSSMPQQCLRFGYIPGTKTNVGFKEFSVLNGGTDEITNMTQNKEYIVFLRQIAYQRDMDFLIPINEIGKNGGIFEITEDNKVLDKDNLFGLGNTPNVIEFIERINSLIYNIKTAWIH